MMVRQRVQGSGAGWYCGRVSLPVPWSSWSAFQDSKRRRRAEPLRTNQVKGSPLPRPE